MSADGFPIWEENQKNSQLALNCDNTSSNPHQEANSKKTVKNIYFQFFGNNFNIDEWYYDDTSKPLTGGRNA